jgi:hypothetical protein
MTIILDGTAGATIDGSLSFDGGYGSAGAAYGCRAWVNFDGTGTVAIRASANVTSITDNGTGNYTVNFTTAMPNTNYAVVGTAARVNDANCTFMVQDTGTPYTTGGVTVRSGQPAQGTFFDSPYMNVAIFR